MTEPNVYLDWNATAPLRPEAAEAVADALGRCGNPSSVHRAGRDARRRVETAREAVAALVGGAADGVIFTSGGTEANHLALLGTGRRRMLVSAVEHSSVLQAVPEAERLPVDAIGRVDLAALAERLDAAVEPALVSVMFANNETGVIQPVREIAALAHARGALFHCDLVQAAGKMKLSLAEQGIDLATLSAHKFGGPPGVGALVAMPGIDLAPLIRGGGQERGRRAGTENLPGIAGFAAAATAAAAGLGEYRRVGRLRDRLEAALAPEAIVIGPEAPRLANTTALAMPGMPAETQVIAFDLAGIMVSAGAACSSGKVGPSHVLAAMGLPPELARSTIRVSLGWSTGESDIARFAEVWRTLYRRAQARTTTAAIAA